MELHTLLGATRQYCVKTCYITLGEWIRGSLGIFLVFVNPLGYVHMDYSSDLHCGSYSFILQFYLTFYLSCLFFYFLFIICWCWSFTIVAWFNILQMCVILVLMIWRLSRERQGVYKRIFFKGLFWNPFFVVVMNWFSSYSVRIKWQTHLCCFVWLNSWRINCSC